MSVSKWREANLGEIYDFSSGLSKNANEFGFGFHFLSFKTVFYNYFIPDRIEDLANTNEKEQEKYSIKKGDVFLTRTSETLDELGMSCVALKDYPEATFNGFTKRLRPKTLKVIDPIFSGYYFRSLKFRNSVTSMTSMTTRASLNNDILSRLPIILPPMEEQMNIANILYSLDKKIALNNRINKNLEEMAQAIFKSWFVDFEPFQDGEFEDSELGRIPKGWKVVELSDIAKFIKGKKPKQLIDIKTSDYDEQYLTIDVLNDSKPQFADPKKMILASEYDILMVMDGASSGRVYFGLSGIVGSTIAKFDVDQDQFKEIVFQYLKINESEIRSHNTGSAIPHTDKGYILGCKLAVPMEDDLYKISDIFRKIRESIIQNRSQIKKLVEIRDSLLPKLMSGEIRVPIKEVQ